MTVPVHRGGCQCGVVRLRVTGELKHASICHCRTCQKAFGAYYAPLVSTRGAQLQWTRGQPKRFQSSNLVCRGFCGECGTPLTYEAPDGIALAAGAFDRPQDFVPWIQYGVEGKLPFVDALASLPQLRTENDLEAAEFLTRLVSFQHPDHDTEA